MAMMDIDEGTKNWKEKLKATVDRKMMKYDPKSPYLNPKNEIRAQNARNKKKGSKLTLRMKPSISSLQNPLDGISEIQRIESNMDDQPPSALLRQKESARAISTID